MSVSSHADLSASNSPVGDTTRAAGSSGQRDIPSVDGIDEALLALQDAQLARVRYLDLKGAVPADETKVAAARTEYEVAVGVARIRVDEVLEHERVAA